MTIDPDLMIVDELGVQAVADALDISREAVRKWRIKRMIPERRREELRELAAATNDTVDNGQPGWPTPPTRMPTWLPMAVGQTPAVQSDRLIELDTITGRNAMSRAEEAIAERDARLAGQHALAVAQTADGDRSTSVVRFYGLRLAGLLTLDFPVLTMAFVAVAQISPIVAAGSAIALSLFLVLGAHFLGGVLRAASTAIPAWCRHLTALAVLIAFLAAIVWVTLDLRLKGLEIGGLISKASDGLVFAGPADRAVALPSSFIRVIGHAAALVTLGSLLFGIAWSYRHHGPATAKAKAELAYRRHLRRLARKRVKLAHLERRRAKVGAMSVIVMIAVIAIGHPTHAATCNGSAVLALIDTTTAYDDADRAIIMPAIENMAASLAPGQRLIIRTVREAPDASRLLFDDCVPAAPTMLWTIAGIWTWLTANPAAPRADRDAFFAEVRDVFLSQLHAQGGSSRTALIGTLERLTDDLDALTIIWLFSDLLESELVNVEDLLLEGSDALVQSAGELSALTGVDLHAAGLGRWHDRARRPLTPRERASLVDSWTIFVQQSGGRFYLEPSPASVAAR